MRSFVAACLVVLTTAAAACSSPAPDVAPPPEAAPARPSAPDALPATAAPQPPRPGRTPRMVARRLVADDTVLRSGSTSRAEREKAGHRQQRAYRKIVRRDWDDRVLRHLPRRLRYVARRNLRAQRELSALSGRPPKTLPRWRIIPPAPRGELKRYYRKAQRRFGVRWEYLAAINLVETRMGRIRGVSSAGAKGPMQFIDPTWDAYGRGSVWDPHDAIMAAGRYLDARGAPGDMDAALYAYNNDVRYVRAVRAYADVMRRDPVLYRGYYHWQVYYRQPGGAVWLPVGWDNT